MNLPDFLTQGQYGEIRLTGHRIDLMHVDGARLADLLQPAQRCRRET